MVLLQKHLVVHNFEWMQFLAIRSYSQSHKNGFLVLAFLEFESAAENWLL